MKAMVVMTLASLLAALPAVSQVPDDKLIVPGQRIGRWILTMTIADLTQMNGAPSQVVSSELADLSRELVIHRWGRLGLLAVTSASDRQRIEVLVATSEEFKTERGIAVNSRREAVEAAYGRPTAETRPTGTSTRLIYDAIGLVVILVSPGLAESVAVFRPGTGRQLWGF